MVILGSQQRWTVTMQNLPTSIQEVVVAAHKTLNLIPLAVGEVAQIITLIQFPKLQEL